MMMQQQQGVGIPSGLLAGDAAAAAAAASAAAAHQAQESGGGGGGGSFSEEERGRMEEGERNSGGGNRWPRQETIALLNIRSDMDGAFRDSSLKGPLWDEVSRKLSELGYHRSAKKCKEKFENVYKYHKRTKDGRTSKSDGKTYRFFEQLEALDTHPPATAPTAATTAHHLQLPPPLHAQPVSTMPAVTQMPNTATVAAVVSQVSTVPSMSMNPMIAVSQPQSQANVAPISINPTSDAMPMPPNHQHFLHPNMSGSMMSGSTSSSSTSSDSEPPERRKKRKRKWKDFFGRLMKEVIDKQEELQMKFLDTLEKRERERMIREEAWRAQEIAKMNREHDLLVQERNIVAAKDAAVISFLQKIAEQQNAGALLPQLPVQIQVQESTQQPPQPRAAPPVSVPVSIPIPIVQPPPPQPPQPQSQPPQSQPQIQQSLAVVPVPAPAPAPAQTLMKNMIVARTDNGSGGDINMLSPSPSRWPKVEVQALIKLRTTLDMKYQENGPKGPLWEEISLAMRKIGYNRNAKRCKEKWENINKYYKKVKESSKKRPEDSKTCPYFHDLDAIYRERGKMTDGQFNPLKPENQMAPIMAQPEQQWPLPQHHHQVQQHHQSAAMDIDHESQNHNDEDEDEDDDEDEDEGGEYEIVTNTNNNNKATSMATIE